MIVNKTDKINPMKSAVRGASRRGNLMLLASVLAPYLQARRDMQDEMQDGGMIPYEDYGMDDSGMMSYQTGMDGFAADTSTLVGNIPSDSIEFDEDVFNIPNKPTYKKKKAFMRKQKRQDRRASRRERKDFKAQLRDQRRAAGMRARGRMYRQEVKDFKDTQ